jgi:hypothetical protein
MAFRTLDRARRFLIHIGKGAAALVLALHLLSHEAGLMVPRPEHVEQIAYDPTDAPSAENIGGGGSGGASADLSAHLKGRGTLTGVLT